MGVFMGEIITKSKVKGSDRNKRTHIQSSDGIKVTKDIGSKLTPKNKRVEKLGTQLEAWRGFAKGSWAREINVRDFIQQNYTPYLGKSNFLAKASEKTIKLNNKLKELFNQEIKKGGVLDINTTTPSSIDAFPPAYIDKKLELIVGLQTDAPLKRAIMPQGGIRLVETACDAYGFKLDEQVNTIFSKYTKTHNQGVFDVYDEEIRLARKSGIITGLPDAYGRGRIIGDYRRVALYGVDYLIEEKVHSRVNCSSKDFDLEIVELREKLLEQISSLKALKSMALQYGFDISNPATTAQEAIQWTYFGYLGAIKEQNGAAMSVGRISTFLDIYINRDMEEGRITETEAQEIIDHLILKLRMVRFLRPPEYNELFSGDPIWATEALAGMGIDGRTLVTKTTYRFLHSLRNLGSSPEPNLTILWSHNLPTEFKEYSSKISIDTSAIQYENDDLMREYWGDDYGIACCVSAMKIGKQMQFFGARCNLAKTLLYAINGGIDEYSGMRIAPDFGAITDEYLDYDKVAEKFDRYLEWIASVYSRSMNYIHYMHDKYCYEKLEFALHDNNVERTMAYGIAGLSVVADSLSAIKYAKVRAIRNEKGVAVDFEIEGDYPKFGNNESSVDNLATGVVEQFMNKLRGFKTYKNSIPTMSILTITSNVVYGKKTGSTPDGRKKGDPFAPGANPMHGRDSKGAISSMCSIAKLPYQHAQDGISYTFTTVPNTLGRKTTERVSNLVTLLDSYCDLGAHHMNVNVLKKEVLLDAMEHPEEYPQLTIRVSGYAVNFIKLTREQQLDVIHRTFHMSL